MNVKDFFKEWKEERQESKVLAKGEVGLRGCPNQIKENGSMVSCQSLNVVPTGFLHNKFDRVYKCKDCGATFASKTSWAECTNEYIVREKNGLIRSDLIQNDCLVCPIPKKEGFDVLKMAKEGKKCPYFKELRKERKKKLFGE